MGYYINLENITLDEYRQKLESAYLPPSRMVLKERLEERFGCFKTMGIGNVLELKKTLKKKEMFDEVGKMDFFDGNYLKILLREINSILPKPNLIADFEGISKETVLKLEKMGIKNTEKLYPRVLNEANRKKLSGETGIGEVDIMELTKLTDLSRIKWVGVKFAYMLYELGYDTVEKASKADPVELHEKINRINKEKNYYKGQIGLNDIRIFVEAAKEVPVEIEY